MTQFTLFTNVGFQLKEKKKGFVRDCVVFYIDICMNMVIGVFLKKKNNYYMNFGVFEVLRKDLG